MIRLLRDVISPVNTPLMYRMNATMAIYTRNST